MRRDVLLLQGPIGPFFARLADDLTDRGFTVHKVNLNGGDRLFYRRSGGIDYSGKLEDFDAFVERLIVNRAIGRLYLFGDCRHYHRVARLTAARHGVRVFVFEEGYVRPNFITLEEGGVNGHSPMLSRDFSVPEQVDPQDVEVRQPKHTFALSTLYSMLYYWASSFQKKRFPYYQHHREFSWLSEGLRWIRSGVRKLYYAWREREVMTELVTLYANNYFVCPLQVHCDMQVTVHSEYNSIEHFIGEVLHSFAQHAPNNVGLVFKHHPMDRAYTDYTALFANLTAELGLQHRVFYVHDLNLPHLLQHAQGTVLINSTVGLSSLFHGTPVKTLGTAVYDIDGLTSQRSLDEFWQQRDSVDVDRFESFRNYLISRNQLNGNLYRRSLPSNSTGTIWPAFLQAEHTWQDTTMPQPTTHPEFGVVAGQDWHGPMNDPSHSPPLDQDNQSEDGAEAA